MTSSAMCECVCGSGGSRGGSLGSIEPTFEKEMSGCLKQLVIKLFLSYMHSLLLVLQSFVCAVSVTMKAKNSPA